MRNTTGTPSIPPPYGQGLSPARLRLILGDIALLLPPHRQEGDLHEHVAAHIKGLETARDDFYQRNEELQRKVEGLEFRLESAKGVSTRWRELYQTVSKDRDRWFRYFVLHLVLDVVVVLVVLGLWGKL